MFVMMNKIPPKYWWAAMGLFGSIVFDVFLMCYSVLGNCFIFFVNKQILIMI